MWLGKDDSAKSKNDNDWTSAGQGTSRPLAYRPRCHQRGKCSRRTLRSESHAQKCSTVGDTLSECSTAQLSPFSLSLA